MTQYYSLEKNIEIENTPPTKYEKQQYIEKEWVYDRADMYLSR